MIIVKNHENVIKTELFVDKWEEEYSENPEKGEMDLVERYIGKVMLEEVKEQKYLGFVLSNTGNNMANIRAIEKKSFGVIRTIMNKLENLKLSQYNFECGIIFMNVILRGSILYAGECYYNVTESQLRSIERI